MKADTPAKSFTLPRQSIPPEQGILGYSQFIRYLWGGQENSTVEAGRKKGNSARVPDLLTKNQNLLLLNVTGGFENRLRADKELVGRLNLEKFPTLASGQAIDRQAAVATIPL